MFMSKINLLIGIAIFATFSLFIANVVVESFSQSDSNNNTKRDTMGNLINGTASSTNNNGNNLSKDYPTNASK
jgi:hypothetical protein